MSTTRNDAAGLVNVFDEPSVPVNRAKNRPAVSTSFAAQSYRTVPADADTTVAAAAFTTTVPSAESHMENVTVHPVRFTVVPSESTIVYANDSFRSPTVNTRSATTRS